ncbi:DUF4268 domain-containing protein [Marinobacter sp. 1-4A]|uniref:DUF4268 domain-containing protein n=1 Tax=Marinobacter sp. 1-4A TaxID=2582919 RepID=UPI0019061B73|nr:DUF4268 domain-containing protein [Marinobacter sp. 1-4A]MBK1853014.1 DUF4268 domain-containing protein [Marinobacter sp. 1-4A]
MRATPFLIHDNSDTRPLLRLAFNEGFSEQWLQEQLFRNPQSLPFGEINPGYREVVPLCMEMNTGAGPIDIVYVTPQGKLVIVETKLWRNPEARRKVIGQILDYAKELQNWSYSDLQREVSRRTGEKGNVPYELVRSQYPTTEEAEFVDGVSNSLAQGDIMLVIAGDGIRSDTQAMIQYLDNTANMKFTLAVIETAVYQTEDKDLTFVQPRTLFKTKEIPRTVFIADFGEQPVPSIGTSNTRNPLNDQYEIFWRRFLSELRLDDPEQPIANPVPKGNVTFPMPPGGGTAWITLYFFKASSEIGCFLRIRKSEDTNWLYQTLKDEAEAIKDELPFSFQWDDDNQKIKASKRIKAEWPPVNLPEVETFFTQHINAFVNVFKPRLERYLNQQSDAL